MFHAKCFDITSSGAIEKPRHHGVCPQKNEILRIGQLRLVPPAIDEAQKPQGLLAPRPELMPGPRLYRDQIVRAERVHVGANQTLAAATQNHDTMHVSMPFEGREPAGFDLEIPQFAVEP